MANGKSLTKNGHGTPIPAIWVDQLICCTEVQFFLCWLLVKPPLCYHWRISTGPASVQKKLMSISISLPIQLRKTI